MNFRFFKLIMKGMWKRKWEVLRASIAILISFTFVAGILLFQENMYQYQTALAKRHFGDWFIMNTDYKPDKDEYLSDNSYLDKPSLAYAVNCIYNYTEETSLNIGYFGEGFIKQGNISLDQGRWPESDDEIAVDWNTLLKLNQSFDIGSEIQIHTYLGSIYNDENEFTKSYRLVGIINNYTSVWQEGKKLPGIIITDNEAEVLSHEPHSIAIYPLKDYIREDNYQPIFDRLKNGDTNNIYFNSSVYSYKPWGNAFLYNYMFILVMIIGITAMTYQTMAYNLSRKDVKKIHLSEGASRLQMIAMSMIENTVLLIISSILGALLAIGCGKLICMSVEKKINMEFYSIGNETVIKIVLTLVLSIVISMLFNIFFRAGKKERLKKNIQVKDKTFDEKTFVFRTHKRLMRTNGIIPNLFIRIFSIVMTFVMLICIMNIYSAYSSYKDLAKTDDLVGFIRDDTATSYIVNYKVGNDYNDMRRDHFGELVKMTPLEIYNKYKINVDKYEEQTEVDDYLLHNILRFKLNKDIKCGDVLTYKGISQDVVNDLKSIEGIENIEYGYFETGRTLSWTGIDYEELGADRYIGDNATNNVLSDNKKYLFATEYAEPTHELYEILCSYIDGEKPDFEAFKNGELVFMFEDKNTQGKYDTSLNKGDVLSMHYLYNFLSEVYHYQWDRGQSSYSQAVSKYLVQNIYSTEDPETLNEVIDMLLNTRGWEWSHNALWDYYKSKLSLKDLEDLSRNYAVHHKNDDNTNEWWDEWYDSYKENQRQKYENGEITEDQYKDCLIAYACLEYEIRFRYEMLFNPPTTNVGAVIRITDENRASIMNDLKHYIPEFGQYTTVASTALLERLLDSQNQLLKDYFLLDELPDEIKLQMQYNQINIRYGINSALVSTGNIVSAYLGQSGFSYAAYSEEKDQMKSKIIETIILYGFSLIAAILVVLVVSVIIEKNRLSKYQNRLKTLKQTGADNGKITAICMMECIRESLWCPFLAVIIMVLDYFVIMIRTKKIG